MQWIQENGAVFFGIVGALYTAARLIVFLTPTPKDDKVVGIIGAVLAKLAGAFGLTLNQGIGSIKKPPSGTTLSILLLFTLIMSGCLWQNSPRADLLASQKIFTATVESLTVASQAGQIGDDEIIIIDGLIQTGNSVLKTWEKTVLGDGDVSDAMLDTFQNILNDLIAWQVQIDSE